MAVIPVGDGEDKDILIVWGQTLATDGSGVARPPETPVIFVPGLLPGEVGRVRVIQRRKNLWRAQLLEIISDVAEEGDRGIDSKGYICTRQRPQCLVFDGCGGCDLQHMSYEDTLYWKKRWVEEALARIAQADANAVLVKPVVGMGDPWRYRNKALLHWDGSKLGFYGVRSHDVVEFSDCLLLSRGMNEAVRQLKISLIEKRKGEKGETGPESLAVTIREDAIGESLFLGITGPSEDRGTTTERLWIRNSDLESQALDMELPVLKMEGTGYLTYPIGELVFDVSPGSFLQVNTRQIHALVSTVVRMAGLKGDERVWDLYSGVGLLGLGLAREANQVLGIEENAQGVRDAERNARRNGIGNSYFIAARVEDILVLMDEERPSEVPDVVIVDPPRKGLSPVVIDKLLCFLPEKILYVSCDPATLARDVGRLTHAGKDSGPGPYKIIDVQPIDMFPWTSHVECVTLMSRVEK